jgi:hypothetical protein
MRRVTEGARKCGKACKRKRRAGLRTRLEGKRFPTPGEGRYGDRPYVSSLLPSVWNDF